jgi:hypothetical protein
MKGCLDSRSARAKLQVVIFEFKLPPSSGSTLRQTEVEPTSKAATEFAVPVFKAWLQAMLDCLEGLIHWREVKVTSSPLSDVPQVFLPNSL